MVDQLNEEVGEIEPEEMLAADNLDAVAASAEPSSIADDLIVYPEDRTALLAAVPEVVGAFEAEHVPAPVPLELAAEDAPEVPAAELAPEPIAEAEAEAEAGQAPVADGEPVEALVAEPVEAAGPEPEAEPAAVPQADPVPEPTALPESEAMAFPSSAASGVSIWPFVAYDVVWLAFAGVIVWQLLQVPEGLAVYESAVYPLTLIGGLVLTVAGPLLVLASWIAERGRTEATSGQLFLSALVRGSVATLLGVTLWWAALLVLDQLRLGRFF